MSTTYRAVVTCDERTSGRCYGLVEASGPNPRYLDRVDAAVGERGWLRGYGPIQTYDVCPGCQTPEQRARVREVAMALGRAPLKENDDDA